MKNINPQLFTPVQLQTVLEHFLYLSGKSSSILPFMPATWEQFLQVMRFLGEAPNFRLRKVYIAPGTLEANLQNNDPCAFLLIANISGGTYMAILRFHVIDEHFEVMLHDTTKGEIFRGAAAAAIMSKATWMAYDLSPEVVAAVPDATIAKKLINWPYPLLLTEPSDAITPTSSASPTSAANPEEMLRAFQLKRQAENPQVAKAKEVNEPKPFPQDMPREGGLQNVSDEEKQRIKAEAIERKRAMQEENRKMQEEAVMLQEQEALKAKKKSQNKKIAIFALMLLTLASATFLFFKGLPMKTKAEYSKMPHLLQGKFHNASVRISIEGDKAPVDGKVQFKYSRQMEGADWQNLNGHFDLHKQTAHFDKIGDGKIAIDHLTGRWTIEGDKGAWELYSLPE